MAILSIFEPRLSMTQWNDQHQKCLWTHCSYIENQSEKNKGCFELELRVVNKIKNLIYLGSFQNEVLSSSGTIIVTFKYLAIATMSHICKNKKVHKAIKQMDTVLIAVLSDYQKKARNQTHSSSHLIESSITRNHQITVIFIDPCRTNKRSRN